MLKTYFHISFFFFILVALTGIWMRAFPFLPTTGLPYDHISHGHSHVAMLGFQFLAVFVIFLTLAWNEWDSKVKKQALIICLTLSIVSVIMFVAFLYQGYGGFSIGMSALHIFIEYWAAIFIYKLIKRNQRLPKSARLFITGSLIALVISSIGPYALGYTSANGLKETAWFDSSIYFYLHFQYNGWLTLFTIGLFLIILAKRNIQWNEHVLIKGFWIYFIALFPSFFSNILWIKELGTYSTVLSSTGIIAQWIAVFMIIYSIRNTWKHSRSITIRALILLTFSLLLIKSTMELGLTNSGLAGLVYETRSVIIGYLHLTLLGFISIFIMTQYFLIGYVKKNFLAKIGLIVFLTGFTLNEALLFWQGLRLWTGVRSIPFILEALLTASVLLGVGILIIWISSWKKEE